MQIKQYIRINKADAFKKLKSQMLKKMCPGNSTGHLWPPMPTATSDSHILPKEAYCSNSGRILLISNYEHKNILT